MRVDIWILRHGWSDDEIVQVFGSREAADKMIFNIVKENWEAGCMDEEECPSDPKLAVQMYFEYHDGDEWYSIESQKVNIHLDLSDDEVVLTGNEIDVVVWALKNTNVYNASKVIGLSPATVLGCVNSAREKLED
jgi:hypothetical protein